jgi:hypothetical protein
VIDQVIDGKHPFDRSQFKDANGPVTAETLYLNQKVSDLISNAEMEQSDYRRGGKPNVFFGQYKQYFGMKVDVFVFNTIVLIGSSLCAARVVALDSTAATRSAKDVTQASSSRAKTPVRLGPSDPEANL